MHRHFAIVLALARHALYAAAALPKDHPQRGIIRHQITRLQVELASSPAVEDRERAEKIGRLAQWYDAGAPISNEIAVLSETA